MASEEGTPLSHESYHVRRLPSNHLATARMSCDDVTLSLAVPVCLCLEARSHEMTDFCAVSTPVLCPLRACASYAVVAKKTLFA